MVTKVTSNNESSNGKANDKSSLSYPYFSMGLKTYNVSMELYELNRQKLVSKLKKKGIGNAVVYLVGGQQETRNDTDHEPIFRQESYFHYLFGVKEPGFTGCIDVDTRKSILFCPRLPKSYATWLGRIKTPHEFQQEYCVDDVLYVDEAEDFLKKVCCDPEQQKIILLMEGPNSDSGEMYVAPELFKSSLDGQTNENKQNGTHTDKVPKLDKAILFPILAECRVIKSHMELDLLRHVTSVTSEAHVEMMRLCKVGMMEYQLESIFRHYCYYHFGCRLVGYTPICACGPNSAVLHYGHAAAPNDATLQEHQICLMDLGSEYHCYGSDVTSSFPANGTFTTKQAAIYSAVLQAQIDVMAMMKPGVSWVDCHKVAERAILTKLIELGIVLLQPQSKSAATPKSKTVDELVEMRMGAVFMPHGLGHLIGIDTHDVGGYLPGTPERSTLPGLKSLRTARILQPDMTLTVEPGCYFIDPLLDEAISDDNPLSNYLDSEILKEFRGMGGVRLEDVVCVTLDGVFNFTNCPRTIQEVEHVMSGGKWPPMKDEAPELCRQYLVT